MKQYKEKIEMIEDDKEVKAMDEELARVQKARDAATVFSEMPMPVRCVLAVGTTLNILSCYGLVFRPTYLFQAFTITDCLQDLGTGDYDVLIPGTTFSGLVALASLLISIACYMGFSRWASRQAWQERNDAAPQPRSTAGMHSKRHNGGSTTTAPSFKPVQSAASVPAASALAATAMDLAA